MTLVNDGFAISAVVICRASACVLGLGQVLPISDFSQHPNSWLHFTTGAVGGPKV